MTSPAKTTVWKRLYRCRKGAAIVEMAIVTPLLVALGVGVFEFGRAVQSYHVIDKGMRDAARYLARFVTTGPVTTCPTVPAALRLAAQNLAIYGNTSSSGLTPVLSFWSDPNTISVTVTCVNDSANPPPWLDPNGGTLIPIVTVAASVPYADLGLLAVLGLGAPTFGIAHQEIALPE